MKSIVSRFLSTTFFAFTFFAFSSPLAALLNPQPTTLVRETGASVIWTIDEGESITGIAEAYYGDASYWTTIWNDNPWIENPWDVDKGWALELRNHTPKEPQELDVTLLDTLSKSPNIDSPEVTQNPALIRQLHLPVDQVQAIAAVAPVVTNTPVPEIKYVGGPLTEAQITYLGQCEAGMDPAKNTGNGYYGAFQFSYGTWKSMDTGYERADMAPIHVQKDAVQRLVSRSSIFGQFPGCSKKMRSIGLL